MLLAKTRPKETIMEAAEPFVLMALTLVGGGLFLANVGNCSKCGNLLHSFLTSKKRTAKRERRARFAKMRTPTRFRVCA